MTEYTDTDQTEHASTNSNKSKIAIIKNFILAVFKLAKKHRMVVLVASLTLVSIAVIFSVIPVIEMDNVKLVNVDTIVRIKEGQIVKLKVSDVSVKVAHFTNDACPEPGKCFGSAPAVQAVEYELSIGKTKYALGTSTPINGSSYQIETISTDYKTYADIKIVSSR